MCSSAGLVTALVFASTAAAQDVGRASSLGDPRSLRPQERSSRRDVALELSAFTHLPLLVGGTLSLEIFGSVVLRAGGGLVAGPYIDAINDVGVGWGLWSANDAVVLREVLSDAMFLEAGAALRPAGSEGIEIAASYALVWAHRAVEGAVLGLGPGSGPIGLDLSIHAIHVQLGGVFLLGDVVSVRVAAGWMHSLGSSALTSANATNEPARGALRELERGIDARVESMAFGPTLTVAIGLRL